MSDHPTPWIHDRSKFADWGLIRDANGRPVAKCSTAFIPESTLDAHRVVGTDPTEAVAKLIAAAPELLAVLVDMTRTFAVAAQQAAPLCDPNEHALVVRARAAINAAKGVSQ